MVTIVVLGSSLAGVIRVLWKKDVIMCACLGTLIKLPVTKITLIEDLAMIAMAVALLLGR